MSDTQKMNPISRLFFKQYRPGDGNFLVIKRPKGVPEDKFDDILRALADDIVRFLRVRAIIVGVDSFSEVKHLDDKEMEKMGWVRKNSVLAFKDEWGNQFPKVAEAEAEEEE